MDGYIEAECLRSYKNLVANYNKLFDINSCLKRENQHLQVYATKCKKLFEDRKCRIIDAIQTRIEREKYHLQQIERLKCKLCVKDNDINTLKQIKALNEEQIDKYQKELTCIIEKYQNQLCKNENSCKCSLSSECKSEQCSMDSKCSCEDKSMEDSKCSCEDKSMEDSKCSCEDKSMVDSKCSSKDKLLIDRKCSNKNKLLVDSKCTCEDKSMVDSKCSCKDKSLSDNSVEHVSEGQIYGDVQQLLIAIDEYCDSKTICIAILTLLKQSKSTICSLIEENDIKSNALTQCQNDLACSTNKLNEELDVSKKKDSEILIMNSDFTLLADELKKISKQKLNLENRLNQVTEELFFKTEQHGELINKFEEQKEELNNIKSCSNIQMCDSECTSREVCEKTNTLIDNIKIIDGLQNNLCNMEKQLKETENLKIISENQCKHLSTQNVNLKNELEIENNNNIKYRYKIENLCQRINKFEVVIKGLEIQNKTYIVEIDELKNSKCAAEMKFNEIIDELYSNIQLLRSELDTAEINAKNNEQFLKNINDEDKKYFEQNINSLKNDIEDLETELNYYKCQYDSLTTKCLLNEKELKKFIEMIQLLQTREFELNKENEEYKEQVSMLCRTVDTVKQELEETIQKNNELTYNNNELRAENGVYCENIDEMNKTLISVRKNESCVRKDLVVYKEKLTKADEEIAILNSQISCIKCKLSTTCNDLTCMEHKLHDTEIKLNEEKRLKENICEKYTKMVDSPTTNFNMEQSIKPTSMKSVECQYEMVTDNYQLGDNCCVADENFTSCNVTNYDAQESNFEKTNSIFDCKMLKKSTHIGIQTNLCCPQTCPPTTHCKMVSVIFEESSQTDNILCCPEPCDTSKCYFGKCESNDSCTCPREVPPLETTSQLDRHSEDCLSSNESELTTKCDCIASFIEKENLKFQLAESKTLLEQYEKDTEKKLCEIKKEQCKNELNMSKYFDKTKLQYKTDMDELTAQLRACKETILCKEKELECCLERENLLKKDLEKLNETIKCKDRKIDDGENKIKTMCDCLEECKKQFVTLKCSLELEKIAKQELDKQLESIVIKPEKDRVQKLNTPEKVTAKKHRKIKTVLMEKKPVNNCSEMKRMRSGADHETGHNFCDSELGMQGRRRGRRGYTTYTQEESRRYPRSKQRGFGNGDPVTHTLPAGFVESLRQQVRKNVGCNNANCYTMGCCNKLYFRR